MDGAPGVEGATLQPVKPMCEVGYNSSYTHNLGNFKSVKIGVSLSIQCPPDEINDVYDFTKSWVDERLQKEVDELPDPE